MIPWQSSLRVAAAILVCAVAVGSAPMAEVSEANVQPALGILHELASGLGEEPASPFQPPGHGGTPPGQGGTPPGQTTPPGEGGTPPGQDGEPPDPPDPPDPPNPSDPPDPPDGDSR